MAGSGRRDFGSYWNMTEMKRNTPDEGTPYQLGRGQAILCEDALHIKRQLHGQRTYFLPGGAALIGCRRKGFILKMHIEK